MHPHEKNKESILNLVATFAIITHIALFYNLFIVFMHWSTSNSAPFFYFIGIGIVFWMRQYVADLLAGHNINESFFDE